MNDRHWLGDVGLAVLLALPTAVLAQPSMSAKPAASTTAHHVQVASADRPASQSRFSLPG